MKFTILQSILLEALQRISTAVPARSTTPILENILFDLTEEGLKITGTDLEVSLTTNVKPSSSEATGALALPARVVTETIRSLPDIKVHFETDDGNRMKITTDIGLYQVAGISKENYPEMPGFQDERVIEIENDLLGRMFAKTIFAVSSEELRPALMGVFLQLMSDELRMVATDGHRLSKIVDKGFRYDGTPIRLIIPPKAVQIAIKNLSGEGKTKMTVDDTGLRFDFDQTTLYTRLVEGEYPDYERVIPRDNDKKLIVNKDMLTASVRRVALFSSALTHQIRFSITQNNMIVASEDMDIGGEAREEMKVEYAEEPMEVGYNAQYVLDILKHIDTEDVVLQLKSPVRAAIITPSIQKEEESFLMLIMPIKLSA